MKQDALFERVSARLKAQVGPDVFASWFGRLKLHSVSKSVVRLSVPIHGNRPLKTGLLRHLIKLAELSEQDLA